MTPVEGRMLLGNVAFRVCGYEGRPFGPRGVESKFISEVEKLQN